MLLLATCVFVVVACVWIISRRYIDGKSECRHKWQTRGINRYGGATYRMCLKCRIRQVRVNKSYEDERWEESDPIPELDDQFDENDNYKFE